MRPINMSAAKARLSFLILTLCASPVWANTVYGIFRIVKGEVFVKATSGRIQSAKIGQKVLPQEVVTTGRNSRAKIVMVDKNEINLSPETQVTIEKYEFNPEQNRKNGLINVLYGKIRSKVEQRYEGANTFRVKTASAVAGVRGTDFLTSFDRSSGESKIVTFSGRVEVGQPGPGSSIINSVQVSKGQFTTQSPGSTPSVPKAVPPAELKILDQSSDAAKPPPPSTDPNAPKAAGDSASAPAESTASGGETGAESREPASTATDSSMLQPADVQAPPPGAVPVPAAPPNFTPGNNVVVPPPNADFVRDVIQTGNAKVDVKIIRGN